MTDLIDQDTARTLRDKAEKGPWEIVTVFENRSVVVVRERALDTIDALWSYLKRREDEWFATKANGDHQWWRLNKTNPDRFFVEVDAMDDAEVAIFELLDREDTKQ